MVQKLSEAASTLLLEVSQDPGGLILRLAALAGTPFMKTNGKTFGAFHHRQGASRGEPSGER
jgi:hypothetical protein